MGSDHSKDERRRRRPSLYRLIVATLTIAAIVKELRLPAEERTWNGIVAGFVPYDFRMPTLERVRERLWDPEGAHLFSPHVFGVGWTVNLGRVFALVRAKIADSAQ
ncbi:DUF5808 domain-containing protein [Cellulomonas composti]|nr:DUF5808 domain-containing protein [Cellulomonas composti]